MTYFAGEIVSEDEISLESYVRCDAFTSIVFYLQMIHLLLTHLLFYYALCFFISCLFEMR